ncbi:MAG: putative RNA methyltransferase [Sciscionella sp.]
MPEKWEGLASRPHRAVFACPVCGESLAGDGQTVRCVEEHVFDIAREGYVNLLLPQHRHSKDPGYSKEMIAGRRDFFDAGHYQLLADGVANVITSYLPERTERVVLDAGCGEGYYLRRLRTRLGEQGQDGATTLCGIDISKHGIRVAAKRDPRGLYAVAGTYHMPVLADHVDVLLTHFSPVSAADFLRVVRSGGVVLIGGPGEDHLYSFKKLLYDTPTKHEPTPTLADEPGFELINTHRIRYNLALRGRGEVANLLLMTPYYWSVDQAIQARLAELAALDTEVDVVLHAYRRTQEASQEASQEQSAE